MFGQTLIEVKLEMLKTLGEISSLCHVISKRMEVRPMIGTDPHNAYHIRYPPFSALTDLTTNVNSFDGLKKNCGFHSIDYGCYIKYSYTTHLDINEPDLLIQMRMEF